MSAGEDMATVRRFVEEVINWGNLDLTDELVAPDHVNRDPTAPETGEGSEGIKELIGTYRSAFPGVKEATGMTDPLEGCRAKGERAKEHLYSLHSEYVAFFDREPFGFANYTNPAAGKQVYLARISRQPPTARWRSSPERSCISCGPRWIFSCGNWSSTTGEAENRRGRNGLPDMSDRGRLREVQPHEAPRRERDRREGH